MAFCIWPTEEIVINTEPEPAVKKMETMVKLDSVCTTNMHAFF